MKTFSSTWWSVQVPETWVVEQDEECVAFTASPEIGVLQLSAARNENGLATDEDLLEFAEEHISSGAKLTSVNIGKLSGFYLQYSDGEFHCREWWLRSGNTVVFVTYTADLELSGQEDPVVDQILTTLEVT